MIESHQKSDKEIANERQTNEIRLQRNIVGNGLAGDCVGSLFGAVLHCLRGIALLSVYRRLICIEINSKHNICRHIASGD